MHSWLRPSVGMVAMALMLWTTTALGQTRPGCDPQAKMSTPETVEGEVIKIDAAQDRVTVRESNGTVHEFMASKETLQDLKVGGRIEAKLREVPTC